MAEFKQLSDLKIEGSLIDSAGSRGAAGDSLGISAAGKLLWGKGSTAGVQATCGYSPAQMNQWCRPGQGGLGGFPTVPFSSGSGYAGAFPMQTQVLAWGGASLTAGRLHLPYAGWWLFDVSAAQAITVGGTPTDAWVVQGVRILHMAAGDATVHLQYASTVDFNFGSPIPASYPSTLAIAINGSSARIGASARAGRWSVGAMWGWGDFHATVTAIYLGGV